MGSKFQRVGGTLLPGGASVEEVLAAGGDPVKAWRAARAEAGLWTRELTVRDRSMLRKLGEALGEAAGAAVARAVLRWREFADECGGGPRQPSIAFLLRHCEVAANMADAEESSGPRSDGLCEPLGACDLGEECLAHPTGRG